MFKFILVICFLFSASVQAKDLVCFEVQGLESTLKKVVNTQQILQNSLKQKILSKNSCAWANIPRGSAFHFLSFQETKKGFIFPVYQVKYSTTGQIMYTNDGVFKSITWGIRIDKHSFERYLFPRNCEALYRLRLGINGKIPDYIYVPPWCTRGSVQYNF